ncbi:MAG: DUF11 domain-containing protein [Candidatus Dormibacteraeota bacterium]|nr:DUF11 domain-containing protein [Candidatus Dormibacteraeota bacterium]
MVFVLTVKNNGPSTATGVLVISSAPGAHFVSAQPSQGSFKLEPRRWDVGSLAPGAAATMKVTLRAPVSLGSLRISADVSSAVSDPNAHNNHVELVVKLSQVQGAAAATPAHSNPVSMVLRWAGEGVRPLVARLSSLGRPQAVNCVAQLTWSSGSGHFVESARSATTACAAASRATGTR